MAGNIYDDTFEQLPAAPGQAPAEDDPFASAAQQVVDQRLDKQRTAIDRAADVAPDRAADVITFSKRYGLPASVVDRNYDTLKRRARQDDADHEGTLRDAPATAAYLSDPFQAAAVGEDKTPLALLEQTARVTANSFRALASGPPRAMAGLLGVLESYAESNGNTALAAAARFHREEGLKDAAFTRGAQEGAGGLEQAVYGGFESVGVMLPGAVLSLMTGSPAPMLAMAGATTAGESYGKGRSEGLTVDRANLHALTQGGVEVLTELIPAKWIVADILKGSGFGKIVMRQLAGEIPGEQIATALQDLDEWATFHPDKPFAEYLAERPDAAVHTLVSTITAVGAMTAIASTAASLEKTDPRAERAEQSKTFFDTIAQTVAGMKSAEKHPQAIESVIAQATEGTAIDKLYAPLDTFTTYWQSVGEDPEAKATELTGDPQAYANARRTGADLAIPTSTYAARIAATEHNAFFTQELRLAPDEMNIREAAAFKEQQQTQQQAIADDAQAAESPMGAFGVAVRQQLEGAGVERSTAADYADLVQSVIGEVSTRTGVDPSSLVSGITVERPDLGAPAPAAPATIPAQQPELVEPPDVDALPDDVIDTLQREGFIVDRRAAEPAPDTTGAPEGEQERRQDAGTFDADAQRAMMRSLMADPKAVAGGRELLGRLAQINADRIQAGQSPLIDKKGEPLQTVEVVEGTDVNASGESAASAEAISRLQGMQARGESFVVYDRAGNARPIVGADAVDYQARPGETFGVQGPEGFRVLDDKGGRFQDAATEQGANRIADQVGSPVGGRVASSDPRTEKQRDAHTGRVFNAVAESAKQLDPAVNEAELRAEFDYRLAVYLDLQQQTTEADNAPNDLLRTIAKYGGLYEAEGGLAGELKALGAGAPFGALAGVPGVFAKKKIARTANQKGRGHGLDVMLQMLHQEPRWEHIENTDMLIDMLDDISRQGAAKSSATTLPGTEELRDIGIRRERQWWGDAWRPLDMLDEPAVDEREFIGDVDTSFNIQEFSQGLFDEFDALEDPKGAETLTRSAPEPAAPAFTVGDRVTSGKFGAGEVVGIGTLIGVKFDSGNKLAVPAETLTKAEKPATEKAVPAPEIATRPGARRGVRASTGEAVYVVPREDGTGNRVYDTRGRYAEDMSDTMLADATLGVRFDAPGADVLDTGEAQPRLPEAGQVREQEVATPEIADLPFSLTAPTGKPARRKGNAIPGQTTLFQEEGVTVESVREWAAGVRARATWDSVEKRASTDVKAFEVNLTSQGDLSLDSLIIARGAQRAGLGTKLMKELTRFADANGLRVVLTAGQRNPQHGTTSRARLVKFYKRFGFVENTGRHKDFSISAGMLREPSVPTPAIAGKQTESPAFKAWFGASKVVDEDGEPLRVFHGTTANFESFDRDRGNIESDFGAGIYFSNNPRDVGENYAGIGPDLEQKLQLRIERLEQDFEFDDVVRERVEAFIEEHQAEISQADQTTPKTDAAIAIELMAREELSIEHGGATMPVYLKLENPAIVGGENETVLTLDSGYLPEEQQPIGRRDTPSRSTPRLDWSARDLQDSGPRVTAGTIKKDYGGSESAVVYQAWIPIEDVPTPQLVEEMEERPDDWNEEEDGPWEPAGYDWSEIGRGGSFPPAKLRVTEDGTIEIVDGNHRLRAWEEAGFTHVPAWVVDERPGVDPDYDEDNIEDSGTLVDFLQGLRNVASRFDAAEVDETIGEVLDAASGESIGLSQAIELLRKSEGLIYATDENGNLAGHEILRQALEAAGFDGVIDHTVDVKFGSQKRVGKPMAGMDEGTVHYIAFEPTQIKSAVGNVGTFNPSKDSILYQDPPADRTDRRGAIRFGPERQFTISLLEKADLSTFLHESGHMFLVVFDDAVRQIRGQANLTPLQEKAIEDHDTLMAWLGATPGEAFTDAQHEQFARGFEAYLMEGKAPSAKMRAAFARFRAWLVGVYRSLKGLKVDLTPDVRRVLDRMVASDAEIAQAEAEGAVVPMFTTPEMAAEFGVKPEEFRLYRATVAEASNTAREQLTQQMLSEVQREQERAWKTQREEIRVAVEAETYAMPVYIALAAMQRGTTPAGGPMWEGAKPLPIKLSRKLIVDRFGADRLKRLPRPFVYSKDGGIDPDAAAVMFGYTSGDELLTALANAEPMRRRIEREADRRMIEQHGSMLLDGTVHEKARAALANDQREAIIRAELRALARKRREVNPFQRAAATAARQESREEIDEITRELKGMKAAARSGPSKLAAAIPPAETIREAARSIVARMKVREIKPQAYWSAARRASQQAIDAALRQDLDGAIAAKQQELISLAVYREATRVKADVEARVQKAIDLSRPAAQQRLAKAGGSFREQINTLLDRYEFAPTSDRALDRREALRSWVSALQAQGLPVEIPDDVIDDTRRIHYRELTTEEVVGVTDAIDHIAHLAQLKNKLLKAAAGREMEQTARDLATSIRANFTGRVRNVIETHLPSEERLRSIAGFFASHRKLAFFVRQLDGFLDGGPLWESIIRPLNEAADREAQMNADATRRLATIVQEAYPGREKVRLYEKQHIPAIGDSLTKMGRLMVALNWGNEDNRQRIRDGYKWNDQQVGAIIDTLDERDWRFVQSVFDFINGYWEEIAAKQTRVVGVAPAKVEAVPIHTKFGIFNGGYFPLRYNERLEGGASANLEIEAANIAKQAAYVAATTRRGHTKERVRNVKMKVRLDFGVLFEHVSQVIHDLSHHEALLDVGRVLSRPEVRDAIYETHGELVYREIKDTVRDVAFGVVPAVKFFEKAINHLRVGATIAGLGWNLTTSMLQPLGLTQSMVRVGPKWIAKGMSRWLRDAATMENTVKWINERSTLMKLRGQTQQREINEIRNRIGVNTGQLSGWIDAALSVGTVNQVSRQGIADSYFFLIQQMQRVADVPTWLGAYEKAMDAGEVEDRAVALADQAVLDSQGGGQVKDLAGVQRGGPLLRLWTNFYSFFNTTYNLTIESTKRTNFKKPGQVGRLAVDYLLLYSVPATLGLLVREALRPGDDDDEAFAEKLVRENLAYLLGTVVLARELSGSVQGYFGYEGPAGARMFASAGRLVKQIEQGEADAAFWRSLNDVAGVLFHYPSGQTKRTIEGIAAIAEGDTQNPAAVVVGAPR